MSVKQNASRLWVKCLFSPQSIYDAVVWPLQSKRHQVPRLRARQFPVRKRDRFYQYSVEDRKMTMIMTSSITEQWTRMKGNKERETAAGEKTRSRRNIRKPEKKNATRALPTPQDRRRSSPGRPTGQHTQTCGCQCAGVPTGCAIRRGRSAVR